jgi:glycosyltransferase involved in cell wall biosynthesis
MGHMSGGGVEATIMNHYRHIDRARVQFDFVVDSDSTLVPKEEIEKLGGQVFQVPPYRKLPAYLAACETIFSDEKPDIVHANINALSVFPLAAARKIGVPVRIAHSHSTSSPHEYAKTVMKNVLRPFSKMNATHLVACSNDSARWLFGAKAFNAGEVRIIKNAIDLDKFRFDEQIRKRMRKSLNITDDQFVIGQIGRLCFQKNQLFALDVMSTFVEHYPDALLLIVGTGELQQEIETKIHEKHLTGNIRLLGHRSDADALYQTFDALIFPSNYEGLPLTAIEAQASSLPIVMSRNVTDEVSIIHDLIVSTDLAEGADSWSKELSALVNRTVGRRPVDSNLLAKAGYDIQQSADSLCDWYEQIAL